MGLLLSSLAVCWAAFGCCVHSATLIEREAAAAMPLDVVGGALRLVGDSEPEPEAEEEEEQGVVRADLAALAGCSADSVVVAVGGVDAEERKRLTTPPTPAAVSVVTVGPDPHPDGEHRQCDATGFCCSSAIAFVVGITGAVCAQTGGGRWDWLPVGLAVSVGFVGVNLLVIRMTFRSTRVGFAA